MGLSILKTLIGGVKLLTINLLQILKRPYFLLRGAKVPLSTRVCSGALVLNSHVGEYSYIGLGCYINDCVVGNYCSIAGYVVIGAMEHTLNSNSTSTHIHPDGVSRDTTIIGNDVWIGTQCVIRAGVKIGTGAVVGANTFVNKDIPPYAVVIGSPARILRYRFDNETINKLLLSEWWFKKPQDAKQLLNTISLNNQ